MTDPIQAGASDGVEDRLDVAYTSSVNSVTSISSAAWTPPFTSDTAPSRFPCSEAIWAAHDPTFPNRWMATVQRSSLTDFEVPYRLVHHHHATKCGRRLPTQRLARCTGLPVTI